MKAISTILKMLAPALILAVLAGACEKNPQENLVSKGQIVFRASTIQEGGLTTRTEYSGLDENGAVVGSSSAYERIDWVAGKDVIRILCPQALDEEGEPNTSCDLVIGTPAAGGQSSKAEAEPVSGSKPFYWGEGEHIFYALYPAVGTASNYFHGEEVSTDDSNIVPVIEAKFKATISGSIPASQSVELNDTIFKPNMNRAYMYAMQKTSRPANNSITLDFHPLVTSFQFALKALDDAMAAMELTSLTLSSTSTNLTGDFTVSLDASSSTRPAVVPTGGTTGKSITVNFPDGTVLSKDHYSLVTVLALGVEQTDLTLQLNFKGGATRKLVLKEKATNSPIEVGACKKAFFKFGVPGSDVVSYSLDPLVDVTLSHFGGEAQLSETSPFKSYKIVNGGEPEVVAYKLKYSVDGGNTWVDDAPDWCATPIETRGGDGAKASSDGKSIYVDMKPQVNYDTDPHHIILAARTPKVNYDLSTLNLATGETVATSTANCYVVQAPGTYKFPLVYGNALRNGAVNTEAFVSQLGVDDPVNYLNKYYDHLDQPINSPYIGVQHSGKAMKAIMVWSDTGGLVSDLSITGSGASAYLNFSVPKTYITQGNVMLGLLVDDNSDGTPETIAWSWHIWVTDEDLGPSGIRYTRSFAGGLLDGCSPFFVGQVAGKTETYQTRNYKVKAVQPESGEESPVVTVTQSPYATVTDENYTLFQWGRKDPMPAAQRSGSNLTREYYSDDPATLPSVNTEDQVSVGTAIQHPYVRYFHDLSSNGTALSDWCNAHWLNLWTSSMDGMTFMHQTHKTIYDPCPVGYKIPNCDTYEVYFQNSTTSNEGRAYFVSKDEPVSGLPAEHPAGWYDPVTKLLIRTGYYLGKNSDPYYFTWDNSGMLWQCSGLNAGEATATFFKETTFSTQTWTGVAYSEKEYALPAYMIIDKDFPTAIIDGHPTDGYYDGLDASWGN